MDPNQGLSAQQIIAVREQHNSGALKRIADKNRMS